MARILPSWVKYAIALLLLAVVFAPRPTVSEGLGLFDYHRPTFFIGPGLYQYAQAKLAPGKDFSVQYGLAQSYISSLFFADTYPKTISNLNIFNAWCKVFFFFCLFVFLMQFYRNTFTATIVTFSAVALQFIIYEAGSGKFYEATLGVPSVGVYRHTFVPLIWIFALCHMRKPKKIFPLVGLCLSIGLAMFWINDTGLANLMCVVAVIALTGGKAWYKNLLLAGAIVFFSVISFILIGVMVYGSSFTAIDYADMFKYMRLFACGYASVKAHWSFLPLDLFMHIISNLVVIATIAYAFATRHKISSRFLLVVALFAAVIKMKFVNQSASQHFFGEAYIVLIVLGYWFQKVVLLRVHKSNVWKVIIVGVMLLLVYEPREYHRGLHAGIKAYLNSPLSFQLPNLFSFHTADHSNYSFVTPQKDRLLIAKYFKPQERIFLISYDDVAYLLESKMVPGSPFVPMMDLVFAKDYDTFYKDALRQKYICIDYRALNAPLAAVLLPNFQIIEKGQYLLVLENKGQR